MKNNLLVSEKKIENIALIILIFIIALASPIFLLFLIHFTGYSEIMEEIFKALVVTFLILKLSNLKWQVFTATFFGFLFGLSESMFYLSNIMQVGDMNVFWQRFLTAVPMHIITVLIILFFARFGEKFVFIGFAAALLFHILFNSFI